MEEILKSNGYKIGLYDNEWVKRNWTIRFFLDEYEAYDNPSMNTPGMYYKGKMEEIDLQTLIDEIEQYIK